MAATTRTRAVVFDFYGTLGEAERDGWWMDDVVEAFGYRIAHEHRSRWSTDRWDGREHRDESQSEHHYLAWEKSRWRLMLQDSAIPANHHDEIVDALTEQRREFRMVLYEESVEVVDELKRSGIRTVVCSNWDWDLEDHLRHTGLSELVDAQVSSAWVGARKPHPHIYEEALRLAGVGAPETVFVGDNWLADVEGPRRHGMRAVHVWRYDEHPGDWLPAVPRDDQLPDDVKRVRDLRPLPQLIDHLGAAAAAPGSADPD